jgi:hypothetical protein
VSAFIVAGASSLPGIFRVHLLSAAARPACLRNDRRHPAILAVGVVGYSHLTGEEEAGTPGSVRERREVARPVDVDATLANVSYPPILLKNSNFRTDHNCRGLWRP